MSAGNEKIEPGKAVEQALRRRASSADNRRDLTRMPQFRVENDMPESLARLLGEIDRAERSFR
jgi:hypothetical protein